MPRLRLACYNVAWFERVFDRTNTLIEDETPSALYGVSRARQAASLAALRSGSWIRVRRGRTHEEIAVSVVAELIAVRRLGHDLQDGWAERSAQRARSEGVRDLPQADA